MKGRKTANAPDITQVLTRCEHWRQNCKVKTRIPEEL